MEIDQQNDQIVVVGNMDVDSIANHLMEKFKRSVEIVVQEIHDRDSNSTENTYGGTEKKETNDTGIKKKEKDSDLKKKTEGTDKEVNSDRKKKEGDIRDIGNKKGELHDKVDVNREANGMYYGIHTDNISLLRIRTEAFERVRLVLLESRAGIGIAIRFLPIPLVGSFLFALLI